MRTPSTGLPLVAGAYVVGLVASPWSGLGGLPLAGVAACVAATLALAGRGLRARSWSLLLGLAAALAGVDAGQRSGPAEGAPGLYRLHAQVESARADRGSDVRVRVAQPVDAPSGAAGRWAGAKIRLREVELPVGARVRALAQVRPLQRARNPTPHPAWDPSDLAATAQVVGEVAVLDAPAPRAWLTARRADIRQTLEATLTPRAAGLARALLLGEGRAPTRDDREAFRNAGLAHLLAVSGLHVGLVALALFGLLVRGLASLPRPPRDPRRAAALGAALGSLAFALLAGGAPSAWRAALLMAAGLGLRALRRRPRPSALLALAALLFALAAPKEVPGPAFLLSLVATLALLGVPPGHGPLRAAFEASARTLVATAPLVLWIFGGVPLLGLLANVAVVPVAVALLVPLAFAHLLAATLGVGALTGALFEALSAALAAWAELFAAPELGMALPPPDLAQGVLLCLLCLVLLLARGPRRVVLALLLFAGLAGAEAHLRWREQPRTLRVTFLDVGQGDAALVDLPEGALLLVDAGTAPAGQDVIAPLLRARRRSTIDLAIVSHAHPDHIGGLAKLGVPIRELWWPGQARAETPDAEASRVVAALAASGTVVRESSALCAASRGRHRRSGALLEVLWPCPSWDPGYDLNDNSLVVRLEAPGAARVLFAGDVESLAEAELVAGHHAGRLSLRADVLKVPHHGSRTSSGLAFLRAVRPQAAVGSQARFHRFGHPHAEVRGRYEAEEIALFLTARDGGVTLRERRLEGAALGRRAGTMLRIPRAAEALSGNRRRRAPRPRRLRPGASGSRSPRSPRPPRPARRARGARNPRRTAHSPRPRPA